MPRIYFGHPINTYNTDIEKFLLEKISETFPALTIENPNRKHHRDGYTHWKETMGSGMNYFFEVVLPRCSAGIFLPFRDGAWGAGVFGEAEFLAKRKLSIYQISPEGIIVAAYLETVRILSIEETTKRIRTASGTLQPY
ncbi:hypothetical protein HYT01_03905 [Candidatus Giovannonibacteria bacterium]|nr:hypothetical protein [Candidatus Giovannonibacteria bacterium]